MKRILIVDGDMAVRAQIGRYARLEGYDVAEASDGYTAVALFRQSTFDFVILAVMLPELDGFSVCQTIRSFSQVPILILSERLTGSAGWSWGRMTMLSSPSHPGS